MGSLLCVSLRISRAPPPLEPNQYLFLSGIQSYMDAFSSFLRVNRAYLALNAVSLSRLKGPSRQGPRPPSGQQTKKARANQSALAELKKKVTVGSSLERKTNKTEGEAESPKRREF